MVAFAPDGMERHCIGTRGDAEGQFNIHLATVVGANGTLYIADSGNFRIQAFDPLGKFRFAFGGPGVEPGRFSRPRGIALDPQGNICVSDAGFNNVQIFDLSGHLLMPLGSHGDGVDTDFTAFLIGTDLRDDHPVECASCHDPHGVPGSGGTFNRTFLRKTNEQSGASLTPSRQTVLPQRTREFPDTGIPACWNLK